MPAHRLATGGPFSAADLSPVSIVLTSWNIKKASASGWEALARQGNASRRLGQTDLLLLQEACEPLDDAVGTLATTLSDAHLGWVFAVSFRSRMLGCGGQQATGILTASSARPATSVALLSRHRELGITPKATLVTRYRLRDRSDTLLVVNAHLLNFEWLTLDDYTDQVNTIAGVIARHDGPVILAGDLNTRNNARQGVVDRLADTAHLTAVFGRALDGRTQAVMGGDLPLDHIYYRGLIITRSGVVGHEADARLSDHNRLSVTFAVPSAPGCE